MRLNRWILSLFVLALVAGPVAADCAGKPHDTAATEAKACCAAAAEGKMCGADCPHAQEAMKLVEAAEKGDEAAMEKLVAMVKESGHQDAMALADKAASGCGASQATLLAMVKQYVGGAQSTGEMTQLAQAAGKGCAKSTASLIAAAKQSDDPKMVELATAAEGGCQHSKDALIAMVNQQGDTATK